MSEATNRSNDALRLTGTPANGLTMATFGLSAGLTSIVFYRAGGPTFMEALGLTGKHTGLLLSSPHLSKALLHIPFGGWVDEVGGKRPFLILLGLTAAGLAGPPFRSASPKPPTGFLRTDRAGRSVSMRG